MRHGADSSRNHINSKRLPNIFSFLSSDNDYYMQLSDGDFEVIKIDNTDPPGIANQHQWVHNVTISKGESVQTFMFELAIHGQVSNRWCHASTNDNAQWLANFGGFMIQMLEKTAIDRLIKESFGATTV